MAHAACARQSDASPVTPRLQTESLHPEAVAVDSEGEVLDILVQPRRDRKAALKLMRKLLKKQGIIPTTVVTDKLASYSAALRELGFPRRHDTGRWRNNRAPGPPDGCPRAS